ASLQMCFSDRFQLIETVGAGNFGIVSKALVRPSPVTGSHLTPNAVVAIKSIRQPFMSSDPNKLMLLAEVRFLRSIIPHLNIVRAHEIFLDLLSHKIHIVMEYLPITLLDLIKLQQKSSRRLPPTLVQGILTQVARGLQHMHNNNFIHRDIKPENILLSTSRADFDPSSMCSILDDAYSAVPVVKISDFGEVRDSRSKAPFTSYISTRWYRAPELLLKTGHYDTAIDIWALGTLAIELACLYPLLPGRQELEQLMLICNLLGSPDSTSSPGSVWPMAAVYARRLGFFFASNSPGGDLYQVLLSSPSKQASERAGREMSFTNLELASYRALANWVSTCLLWDPACRATASEALAHYYFS
ncbi:kinase-like domain-containing protein, partial [Lipomyces oligophaga]|uniref:kinase-like domain-containing protein n=1 Tax=Lipomyces oligophaga TaxID=45792 RepID=UPI0034CF5A16